MDAGNGVRGQKVEFYALEERGKEERGKGGMREVVRGGWGSREDLSLEGGSGRGGGSGDEGAEVERAVEKV